MGRRSAMRFACLGLAMAAALGGAVPGWAAPVTGPGSVPDYFETPNWAFSPPLTKFKDALQPLPLAQADIVTYPGTDYYEISLQEYSQVLHSDMPATRLRGYVQTNAGTDTTNCTDPALNQETPCTAADNTLAPAAIRYLGPVIVATRNRPVRVKFTNNLGTGASGNLFVPVDTTLMGSGDYDIDFDPISKEYTDDEVTGTFTQNRATLHLHGGRTPWISDGTPHQWITPAGDSPDYPQGVSVFNVPDMPDPGVGSGSQTFYWTNQQSARLMFYHDHAWGITRLNVYVGEAAGYLITDAKEQELIGEGGVLNNHGIDNVGVPLVIQDKTFVDPDTIGATDPTWAWGSYPWDGVNPMQYQKGDLWWPHVYMPAQNPYNPDLSGINPFGRWHYGPWFWPPTPLCYNNGGSDPLAVAPWCVTQADVDNEYYFNDPNCYPTETELCTQPPRRPGVPNVSWGAEAFLDTMLVNGTAYPTTTVDPKPYRFRILNASHDRFLNLQLYQAVSKGGYTNPTSAPYDFTGTGLGDLTEVAMVPAVATPGFPPTWPADGREGGVPDPFTAGPAFIQIGTEGGFMPKPLKIDNQPIQWNLDPTMFNVGNVLQQRDGGGAVILAPAERADVVVDFSKFAGKTLILYNDAPTAFPALDPHYDYYTGAPDRTDMGGYPAIPAGVGPNNRTIMQIHVSTNGGTSTAPPNDYNATLLTDLENAFKSTGTVAGNDYVPGVFAASQDPIVVGQTAYNSTYNTTFGARWPNWGISRISDTSISYLALNPDGTPISPTPVTTAMKPKAIHDEMGGTFDEYGRMSAKLGLEVPFSNAAISTFALQNYVDPPTEYLNPEEVQIWKITHNGVDTHPIHFHLFDVQLINRVGWDGFIRLPDDNELGWRDTLRISPLEDTIVALRPKAPLVPFGLPTSYRPLNPQTPLGTSDGFSQINPLTGGALPDTNRQTNVLWDFGWEYVWHCHILSHEENDMMRSVVFTVPSTLPAAPSDLAAATAGDTQIDLAWTDPTPAATSLGDPANEIGFRIERAVSGGDFEPYATALANQTAFSDTGVAFGTTYAYRVLAFNQAGDSPWSGAATASPTPVFAGSVVINGDATYAMSASATLTISATVTSGSVASMRFSKDGGATWVTAFETYATSRAVTLTPAGDGVKSISVQFQDGLGYLSPVFTDTIILDGTKPTGSVVIDGGSVYNTSASLSATLTLAATDATGVTQMQFSKDGGTTWTPWETYATTRLVTLAPAGDGVKTISVRFKDVAGNVSLPYTDTIIAESTKPVGSVVINGGNTYTTSLSLSATLTLSATDATGVTQMQFSKDGGATWTPWETYATTRLVTLAPAGDGVKTISVRFKDIPGNVSLPYADTIIADLTRPTGTILINGGAATTTSASATLTLSASDANGVTQMQFSKDGGATWTPWETYATTRLVTLTPPGPGLKTVAVRFRDTAGNVSLSIQASITLL